METDSHSEITLRDYEVGARFTASSKSLHGAHIKYVFKSIKYDRMAI